MKRLAAAVSALAILAVPAAGWTWGSTGHRLIGVAAAERFPTSLPAFLRSRQAVQDIGELAREPDRWKGDVGKLHDAMREPYHFMDIDDDGKVLGGPSVDAQSGAARSTGRSTVVPGRMVVPSFGQTAALWNCGAEKLRPVTSRGRVPSFVIETSRRRAARSLRP